MALNFTFNLIQVPIGGRPSVFCQFVNQSFLHRVPVNIVDDLNPGFRFGDIAIVATTTLP